MRISSCIVFALFHFVFDHIDFIFRLCFRTRH